MPQAALKVETEVESQVPINVATPVVQEPRRAGLAENVADYSLLQTLLNCLNSPASGQSLSAEEFSALLDESLAKITTLAQNDQNSVLRDCVTVLSDHQQLRQQLAQQRKSLIGA